MILDVPQDVGIFLQRENRFLVRVEVAGREQEARLPNSGRLSELLVPGARLLLARRDGPRRKTRYDLSLVWHRGLWVSVDAHLPNLLVAEALRAGKLPPFLGYTQVHREAFWGQSRLDFHLSGSAEADCWLEVKSVTLVGDDGVARFPDAPTSRGRRHLDELVGVVQAGQRAAVLFIVQRPDAESFAPHDVQDPAFGHALRRAAAAGVEVYAYRCRVAPNEVAIAEAVAVRL